MKCPKCFKELADNEFSLTRDKRGVPEAHCPSCGAFIQKLSTNAALDYYEAKLKKAPITDAIPAPAPVTAPEQSEDKMMCRWCCEDYFVRLGRMGTVYQPVEAQFCPMCGRKRKPTDKDY